MSISNKWKKPKSEITQLKSENVEMETKLKIIEDHMNTYKKENVELRVKSSKI